MRIVILTTILFIEGVLAGVHLVQSEWLFVAAWTVAATTSQFVIWRSSRES